ncbi:MAG TPA: DUF58 domain-containing protein [Thermoanaerobaculia bacterium]|nr:DUF58 domain-containing protein [Thermoanaerobaculia bacterium]
MGLSYIVGCLLVGVAATNTGNNALYIVMAVMLGLMVVSGLSSRVNLRGLDFDLEPPGEVFANRPFHMRLFVRHAGRVLPRWLLVFSLGEPGQPLLVPYLPRRGSSRGFLELLVPRRGRHRFSWVHVGTIFPLGFFHKGLRYPVAAEVLVYPELFAAATVAPERATARGDGFAQRVGWGHDLHSLRAFRHGDDPRRIHWKQTARTGSMIYTEREAEEGRRLSIVFDNAVGALPTPEAAARFERLVSEAATAAVDYLSRGYEVELVTRDERIGFAGGPLQRRAVLGALALVEARPSAEKPLHASTPTVPQLRLAMEAPAA